MCLVVFDVLTDRLDWSYFDTSRLPHRGRHEVTGQGVRAPPGVSVGRWKGL